MGIDQIMIVLSGVLAAWINHDPRERVRRWGCVVGLVGQPFFLYATWTAGQWGQFAVTIGYTVAFVRGLRTYWLTPGVRDG